MFTKGRFTHSLKHPAGKFLLILLAIIVTQANATLAQIRDTQQASTNSPPANQNQASETRDPRALLASAHTIYVNSQSGFVKNKAVISALNDHKELRQYGLGVTDSMSSADLVLSIDRQPFTIEYSFTVIHARTRIVVASGHVNSLFGTVPGKIADSFAKQLKAAHQSTKGNSK